MAEAKLDLSTSENMEVFLLSKKPSQRTTRYTRVTAFGNHFRVEDKTSSRMINYNSGVASIFEVPLENEFDTAMLYVGLLQNVLLLDYGPLPTPIILLQCEWMKSHDNFGNATYIRDESGFLVVNFRPKLPRLADPFIFPSQATQMFFSDVVEKPGWKVVLRKEARAKCEVLESADPFISTTVESTGLSNSEQLPLSTRTVNLVGAIELSAEDNLLAHEAY